MMNKFKVQITGILRWKSSRFSNDGYLRKRRGGKLTLHLKAENINQKLIVVNDCKT